MIDFIDLWILQKQKPALRHKIDVDWKKYTIDLESECNGLRIQKEAQLTGDSKNIVDYDCTKTEQDNSYHCVAKREPIPLDDLILCYSDGKFNCLSINDVLHALADRKRGERSINPHTGKEYEVDFLNRMEDRYGDLLDLEKYPHRIIEFTTEDRFGYGDKIFPDDEDLSFEISETTQPILSIPKTLDEALAGEQDLTILYFYQVWELGHKYFVTKDIVDEIDKLKSPQFKIIFIDLQDSAELWNSIKGKVKNKTPIFVIFKKGKIISKINPTENLIKEILEKTI
jgi:hypothetical protein